MAVKVSGLVSGLDTDSIVKELVSAYSMKKDKFVKAQKKLEWTMDSWKTMNTKVYGFYSSSLSNMRYSNNYNLKSATISNSTVASISTSADAVVGNQSLSVTQLATSGYLTGGKVTTTDSSQLTAASTLSKLGITGGSLSVNGNRVDVTADMTVGQLVSRLKQSGVNASFDATSQRFFVSSKASGAANDYSVTGADANGLDAIQKLGLFVTKDSTGNETAEVQKYREMADAGYDVNAEVTKRYNAAKYTTATYTAYLQSQVKSATADQKAATTKLATLQASGYDWSKDYKTEADYTKAVSDLQTSIAGYVNTINDKNALLADPTALTAAMDADNASILTGIQTRVTSEVQAAKLIVPAIDGGTVSSASGAVRITGVDSIIKLNGASFTSNTNSYSINGLNINATALTTTTTKDAGGNVVEKDNPVTITTSSDTKGLYDKIVKFFTDYNSLITGMDTAYNAASADGLEPLSDDEKTKMTDTQVETWETKIKTSLLRRDSRLGELSTTLKSTMLASSVTVNGETYNLASFGIATGSYFSTSVNERGNFHIDGNAADSTTSGKTDKLMEAISNNPDAVIQLFQNLSQNVYSTLSDKMSSSSLNSAFTIYNDKQMSSQYSTYKDKISEWDTKLKQYEDFYYKKFSTMETALSKLQSQTSALSGLLG